MVKPPLWESSTGALAALINTGQYVQTDLITIDFIPAQTPWLVGMTLNGATRVAYSTDGKNFSLVDPLIYNTGGMWGLAYGKGLFVPALIAPKYDTVSNALINATGYSLDGRGWYGAWTDDLLDSGFGVGYGNGVFVAVGQDGTTGGASILTTSDPTAALTIDATELVPDSDLSTDPTLSGWTLGSASAWVSGKITTSYSGANDPIVKVPINFVSNLLYEVTINYTMTGSEDYPYVYFDSIAPETWNGIFGQTSLKFRVSSDFTISENMWIDLFIYNPGAVRTITSVSVKKVISNWTQRTLGYLFDPATSVGPNTFYAATYGNSTFVIGGTGRKTFPGNSVGHIETSSDGGVTWVDRANGFSAGGGFPTGAVFSVGYGNGLFLAGGKAGGAALLQTSSDNGVTWNTQTISADFGVGVQAIAYGKGMYVIGGPAIAGGGIIQSSPDGITWTTRSHSFGVPGNFASLVYGMTYANGLFLAVGCNATQQVHIETSTDGITWTVPNLLFNAGTSQSLAICAAGPT